MLHIGIRNYIRKNGFVQQNLSTFSKLFNLILSEMSNALPSVSRLLDEAALVPKTDSKSTRSSPELCGGGICGAPYPSKGTKIHLSPLTTHTI